MLVTEYGPVKSLDELHEIIRLQQQNLPGSLSSEEIQSQGYVTVSHDYGTLKKMHLIEPSIVARHNGHIVGYALAMTLASREDIPILQPMFQVFDQIYYKALPLTAYSYIIVGQVCIDKNFRGSGTFQDLYNAYRKHLQPKYDFAITEIALDNPRSIRAHEKIDFKSIHEYTAPNGVRWSIVVWEWG